MSDSQPVVCVDTFEDEPAELARLIVAESRRPTRFRLAADGDKLWTAGTVVTVRFLEPEPRVDEEVLAIAREWTTVANITLAITYERDADIRISYRGAVNMSLLGRDSAAGTEAQRRQPSMWLPAALSDRYRRRVVLHEFGHALGCIHEHQSPAGKIPWNVPAVLDFYGGQHGWSHERITRNILGRYDRPSSRTTAFDRSSIMLYPIPAQLVADDSYAVGWNEDLSDIDKLFIRELYPGR